jgi:predicted dinucleotide-binding enzyme
MLSSSAISLQIGLFGAGRVASALAPALATAGHRMAFVASRTPGPAQALAAALACPVLPQETALAAPPPADVYLLAVPDTAVPALLAAGQWPAGALLVHVAGALPLAVFAAQPLVRGGVLYPLQTFSPGRRYLWKPLSPAPRPHC